MRQTRRSASVNWPAVIKYEGDEELTVIGSGAEWDRDAEQYLYSHKGHDLLIDSSGCVFRPERRGNGTFHPADTGEVITLDDFIRLVRVHASNSHRCCIEKIGFRSVAEGIRLVASMNEQD